MNQYVILVKKDQIRKKLIQYKISHLNETAKKDLINLK